MQIDPDAINSDVVDADIIYDESEVEDPFPTLSAIASEIPLSDGDTIDAVIVGDDSDEEGVSPSAPSSSRQRRSISALHSGSNWDSGTARDATTKAPSLDEWTNFFGKIVLRVTCDWYLSYAFRGVDEDMLSDREIDRLAMTDDERKLIAVPLAELSNKSKFMRKHGRAIVASGDSFNALVTIGAWMSRVNRIAAKHKPHTAKVRVNGTSGGNVNGNSGQSTTPPNGASFGTSGGRVPNGFRIFPGSG